MDIRKVKKLMELLEESGMAEIEITEGDDSVRIVRQASSGSVATQMGVAAPPVAAGPPPSASVAAASSVSEAEPDGPQAGQLLTAPMVGTFYRAPAPGSAPFVDVGKDVAIGDTVCIIEAMKMMNQIEADRAGRIKEILTTDGEPVEFGQPLFVIE